jgi:hypothetical protein
MRACRFSSAALENLMLAPRSVGSVPGRFASSGTISSPSSVPKSGACGSGIAVGAEGWEMAFWPTMEEPSARPAQMWWEKLELTLGMTPMESGMPPTTCMR